MDSLNQNKSGVSKSETDVVIASAFGRGNWLAVELVEKGLSVALIDVSDSLGRWAPEDWEGPFGLLQSEKLTASQQTRLTHEDYSDPIADGFVVWGKEGPIDFKGPLSNYWLSQPSPLSTVHKHIQEWDGLTAAEKKQVVDATMRMPFSKSWLVHLSHQFASNVFMENADGVMYGDPLPLFSNYAARRVSRRGYQKGLDWCRDKGVKVFDKAKIADLLADGKFWKGIEIQSEWSGAMLASNLVWSLSSQETEKLSPKLSEFLFPKGIIKPSWVWVRYRVRMDLGEYRNTIPLKFIMMDDAALTWSHQNFVAVQRTVKEDDFDCWIRIPAHSRFHRAYLDERGIELTALIEKKIPFTKALVLDMPQDYLYEYDDLGPSLFPVFHKDELKDFRTTSLKGIYYTGPEWGTRLDWTGRFLENQKTFNSLIEWKQKEIAKQEARRDRQVHAP